MIDVKEDNVGGFDLPTQRTQTRNNASGFSAHTAGLSY
jgi:hypothetical protein